MSSPHSIAVLFGIFATSFVIALSGALMPGPVLTVTISESTKRGFWAGPLIILGHGILELSLVVLLLLGLGPYLRKDIVFGMVGVCGAAILIWMALGMFRSIPYLTLNLEPAEELRGNPVRAGVLMSLANPYFTIWWATIGVGYIFYAMKFGAVGVIAFFSGHISADFAWYSVVSFAISKGRRLISDLLYKKIIGFCASALVIFSIWFGYMGLKRLVSAVM